MGPTQERSSLKKMSIQKREDDYARRSASDLKNKVKKEVTGVFTTALSAIELALGKEFEGYERLRKAILDAGNDAVRNVAELIDSKYNIEVVPEVWTIKFKKEGKENESA